VTLSISIAPRAEWPTINSTLGAGRFGHWIGSSRKTCGISGRIFYSPISLSSRTYIVSNMKIPNALQFASTISMARSLGS
jgi:hypothetical protein